MSFAVWQRVILIIKYLDSLACNDLHTWHVRTYVCLVVPHFRTAWISPEKTTQQLFGTESIKKCETLWKSWLRTYVVVASACMHTFNHTHTHTRHTNAQFWPLKQPENISPFIKNVSSLSKGEKFRAVFIQQVKNEVGHLFRDIIALFKEEEDGKRREIPLN